MVARAYCGLGPPDLAARAFDQLTPWVVELMAMQAECKPMGPDYMAMGVALDGLQTAAFHFTRRPHFYFQLERPPPRGGNDRLGDRGAAIAAFDALEPYARVLGLMRGACRPFGRDYMAITIPAQCLDTAAFHFTRIPHFYGAKSNSAGPIAPAMTWRAVRTDTATTMNDHRRFPGCKLRLTCTQCGWAKGYDPERLIDRLRKLRAGGHHTQIGQVARRVRPCPRCGVAAWQADFAWPSGMRDGDIKRLANLYRN